MNGIKMSPKFYSVSLFRTLLKFEKYKSVICVRRHSFNPVSSETGKKEECGRKVLVAEESVSSQQASNIFNGKVMKQFKSKLQSGPTFEHFISNISKSENRTYSDVISNNRDRNLNHHPYIKDEDLLAKGRKVYFEVYGCQMNVSDTEIVWSILQKHGYKKAAHMRQADVILVVTCSIREGAEKKVWNLLEHLKALKQKRANSRHSNLQIGILGCMAENLKHRLIEQEKMVDLVAGPDSYRDLPRMLANTGNGQASVNVLLSLDETYADIVPIRLNENSSSAYVSIMRGCDNMCSYCIVPFTRGRERSRPLSSILQEIKLLSDQGIKEVILLGQNVNSYRDTSGTDVKKEPTHLSRGFSTIYKTKLGGQRFYELLDKVSEVNPEMRVRFTSPHPKDFPDEVLHLMKNKPNICKQIHLPAQSGNDRVLKAMRRGYTRKSYIDLVNHIRSILPDVALSSDFICGFCDETEEEFLDTLSLIREIKYSVAYLFSYSMRQKTFAYHKMTDSVAEEIKIDRLNRMIAVFREEANKLNQPQIGSHQLVLVEGTSKRSAAYLFGRNDQNIKVIFPKCEIPLHYGSHVQKCIQYGDYIVVQVNDANSQVLKGIPLYHSTLLDYYDNLLMEHSQT